jgi:hypothetical protein
MEIKNVHLIVAPDTDHCQVVVSTVMNVLVP